VSVVEAPAAPAASGARARLRRSDALLLAAVNLLWSGSAVAVLTAVGEGGWQAGKVGPFTLAAARFAPAALLFCLVQRARRESVRIAPADRRSFLLLGGVGLALVYALFYWGIRSTTATEATLLVAAEPVLIALIARLWLGERMRFRQAAGMAAAFLGVYFIVAQGPVLRLSGSVVANATIVLALACEAWGSVLGKRLTGRYAGLSVVLWQMAIGAMLLTPLAAWEFVAHPPGNLGAAEWGAIGYVVVVCSFLCYGVWFSLLKRCPVSSMGGFLFLQPVFGPFIAWAVRGEAVGLWTVLGGGLVVAAVYLVAVRRTLDVP